MERFSRTFVLDYLEWITEEIDKIRRYGSGTVDIKYYIAEVITPEIIFRGGYFSLSNVEFMGINGELNGNPFAIKVLSPQRLLEKLKHDLKRSLTKNDIKSFTIEFVTAEMERLPDSIDYYILR